MGIPIYSHEIVETTDDVHFPKAGLDLSLAFARQPARPVAGGEYARTCRIGVNVRGFEAQTRRNRGGSRSGLSKYVPTAVIAGWVLQELNVIVGTFTPPVQSPPPPPLQPVPLPSYFPTS